MLAFAFFASVAYTPLSRNKAFNNVGVQDTQVAMVCVSNASGEYQKL